MILEPSASAFTVCLCGCESPSLHALVCVCVWCVCVCVCGCESPSLHADSVTCSYLRAHLENSALCAKTKVQ